MKLEIDSLARREMLRACGLGVLGFNLTDWLAADDGQKERGLTPLNRFPRMVQEYFVARVREAERISLAAKAEMKTKQDAEGYVKSVRKKIRRSFGELPEKTPLNAKVTGVVKREAYTIEKIIFESRPGFLVTANLYLPRGRKSPLPGVVGTCGHSTNGKAAEAYQAFAQGLARMGYVVLIYDPIGQGERLQYPDEHLKSAVGPGVREHLLAGNHQFLIGEFFGAWRAWDGIRALDYLLSRDEVDPQHVGVTGNSGGGTMTTWLCGLEQRWTMAAPSCFVTTFRRNMENELPADTEQCPPKALALGLDHDDFLAALAPKPIIILAKEKDYFDVRGTQEAFERLKRLYKLLGAEDQIALFVGPSYHGYSQENREAMYRWFNRATGVSEAKTEPKLTIEEDKTLWCAPQGQVATRKSRTVFSYTRDQAKLFSGRKSLTGGRLRAAVSKSLGGLGTARIAIDASGRILLQGEKVDDAKALTARLRPLAKTWAEQSIIVEAQRETKNADVLSVMQSVQDAGFSRIAISVRNESSPPAVAGRARYRILRHRGRPRGYPLRYSVTYAVETEPGIHAIVYRLSRERLMSRVPQGKGRAVLYVSHHSSDAELREEPLIRQLIEKEKDAAFFTCDVRGIGDSQPDTCGENSFLSPYGSDYFYAIHSIMLDRPYVAQRTFDLLRVINWLARHGHKQVHLAAKGWGAIPATFAAVLAEQVVQVTLKNALTAYDEIAQSERYNWPLSSLLPGALTSFDLPDCYTLLRKEKKLRQIEPWGATAGESR